ncbi:MULTISPECIES: uracil-DNA glycosylase [Bacillaceae]|uniref:Uracil-DNA glycosylase n=1 Tax=Domibacillus aminovorans TaxID=29332 RepID=A0A177L254_9BACI|nr:MULTISPECIES: uracil-DNA glycosylase [Bacillaceae]OAH54388.1 uracil-DNA glycosylase [Domibacillus aminovorans]OAH58851.1 uracil-DNA glycosylase [Domibacillus aminovorans]
MTKQILKNDWGPLLESEFDAPYYKQLRSFLKEEYKSNIIYPSMDDIFNSLHFTPYEQVKVVILGQDPYHGPGQAHGLSFSVQPGIAPPPSLKNMYKELNADLGCPVPNHGYLKQWADEGVLLLNTVLTVRDGQAHSHRGKGWEIFTDRVITLISEREKPAVFLLWGRPAQSKRSLIDENKHRVIQSPHPSPLSASRGFFGSRPFSKANDCLAEMGEAPINWCLNELS